MTRTDCFDAAEKAQNLRTTRSSASAARAHHLLARHVPAAGSAGLREVAGEADTAMSTVVVRARDANGHDVIDVKVFVDGELLLSKLQGTAVTVDPGPHKVPLRVPERQDRRGGGPHRGGREGSCATSRAPGRARCPPHGRGKRRSAETPSKGGPGAARAVDHRRRRASSRSAFPSGSKPTCSPRTRACKNGCGATSPPQLDPSKFSALQTEIDVAAMMFGVGDRGHRRRRAHGSSSRPSRATRDEHATGSFGVLPLMGGGGFASFTGHSELRSDHCSRAMARTSLSTSPRACAAWPGILLKRMEKRWAPCRAGRARNPTARWRRRACPSWRALRGVVLRVESDRAACRRRRR